MPARGYSKAKFDDPAQHSIADRAASLFRQDNRGLESTGGVLSSISTAATAKNVPIRIRLIRVVELTSLGARSRMGLRKRDHQGAAGRDGRNRERKMIASASSPQCPHATSRLRPP